MRALLEAETARLAAGKASPEQLARLRQICREGQTAAEADDFGTAVAANNLFHAEIAVIGGNAVLGELADIVGRRVQWYYRMVAPARSHGSWAEHLEMIEAIRGRRRRAVRGPGPQAHRADPGGLPSPPERLRAAGAAPEPSRYAVPGLSAPAAAGLPGMPVSLAVICVYALEICRA